jgi:hypothetical protein
MKMYGEEEVESHTFLTSALDGAEWSASHTSEGGKNSLGPLDNRLSGPQSQSGGGEKEK